MLTRCILTSLKNKLQEWNAPAQERRLIQDIFPNLNDDEREFIMTGYTPADWRTLHGE